MEPLKARGPFLPLQLDFLGSRTMKMDSLSIILLKIPFRDKQIDHDYVIVQVGSLGQGLKGKIVHMGGNELMLDS